MAEIFDARWLAHTLEKADKLMTKRELHDQAMKDFPDIPAERMWAQMSSRISYALKHYGCVRFRAPNGEYVHGRHRFPMPNGYTAAQQLRTENGRVSKSKVAPVVNRSKEILLTFPYGDNESVTVTKSEARELWEQLKDLFDK